MFRFFRMLENVFAAAAFAEEGDRESCRLILGEETRRKRQVETRRKQTPRPRARMHF